MAMLIYRNALLCPAFDQAESMALCTKLRRIIDWVPRESTNIDAFASWEVSPFIVTKSVIVEISGNYIPLISTRSACESVLLAHRWCDPMRFRPPNPSFFRCAFAISRLLAFFFRAFIFLSVAQIPLHTRANSVTHAVCMVAMFEWAVFSRPRWAFRV